MCLRQEVPWRTCPGEPLKVLDFTTFTHPSLTGKAKKKSKEKVIKYKLLLLLICCSSDIKKYVLRRCCSTLTFYVLLFNTNYTQFSSSPSSLRLYVNISCTQRAQCFCIRKKWEKGIIKKAYYYFCPYLPYSTIPEAGVGEENALCLPRRYKV